MRYFRTKIAVLLLLTACGSADKVRAGYDANPQVPVCSASLDIKSVEFGDSARYFVPARLHHRDVVFLLDTGAAESFVYGTNSPQEVSAGCFNETLPSRDDVSPFQSEVEGVQVAGTFGVDFFFGESETSLDWTNLRVEQGKASAGSDLVCVPFSLAKGHIAVDVLLDGSPRSLLFDTGAGHTLLLGDAPRAGDIETFGEDAKGNLISLYQGSSQLQIDQAIDAMVPVVRAPEFPYFEETLRIIGGDISGLLGVTSFPQWRGIRISTSSSQLCKL